MLKIKSKPGQPIVLDTSKYPDPTENTWHIFLWVLQNSVIADTLQLCGQKALAKSETAKLSKTAQEQSRFVNMLDLKERCDVRLRILNRQG